MNIKGSKISKWKMWSLTGVMDWLWGANQCQILASILFLKRFRCRTLSHTPRPSSLQLGPSDTQLLSENSVGRQGVSGVWKQCLTTTLTCFSWSQFFKLAPHIVTRLAANVSTSVKSKHICKANLCFLLTNSHKLNNSFPLSSCCIIFRHLGTSTNPYACPKTGPYNIPFTYPCPTLTITCPWTVLTLTHSHLPSPVLRSLKTIADSRTLLFTVQTLAWSSSP